MSDSIEKRPTNSQNITSRLQYIPNSSQAYQQESKALNPGQIISIMLKYKWIILLFVMVGATTAWFFANTVTPKYESNGSLLISTGENSTTGELSQIISQATGHKTNSTLENELQILGSVEFSHQVTEKLLEEDLGETSQYPILWTEAEDGTRQRASKGKIAGRIYNNLKFFQPVEESDVVKVSFQSTSPQEASTIVNLAMRNYINNSTQQNQQAAKSTAEFLANEKEEVKSKLQEAEQELRAHMNATGIVQVNQQATGMVNQRANAEVELQRIQLELRSVEESITDYKKQLEKISPGLTEQFTEAIEPRIRNARDLLASYTQERSLIISKNPGVLEEDPVPSRLQYLDKEISRLKEEIGTLSSKLFSSDNTFLGMSSEDQAQRVSDIQARLFDLEMQQKQLQAREYVLKEQKNEIDADFNSLPRGMIELSKLQRDVRIYEELFVNVSRQYADMAVLQQAQSGFGRIVDPGNIPKVPISPNKKIFLLLGLMLGGFMAVGYIAIREFTDNSVNEVGQLQSVHFPPLTVVPAIDKKKAQKNRKSFEKGEGEIPDELVLLQDRKSITSEAIRRLKNNIIYQNGDRPPKSIVITSPEKGDGKSTIASNLGIAFAEEGYWTLVIDADFRRPRLHKNFGLQINNGLYNYLNSEISFENLLRETDLKTLKVITAGHDIEMPEVISNSTMFRRMLKKMEDTFDVIIIDTAPYGIISDSSALLKYAEAAVLVAKYRKTNKGMLFKTMEELKQINANVISIVLNNFDHQKEVGNFYGNGYYQTLYSNYDEYL
jgi:capsular exopolysaccharide synthesis family protein